MSTIQTGGQQSLIDQRAKHWLFVEGSTNNSFDPDVLRTLLTENDLPAVNVSALGSCENLRLAAKAMVYQHKSYYFIIDRDGHSETFVEESWNRFPDPDTYNLLVWRKRELENYFIDPAYILQSQYLVKSEDELRVKLLSLAQTRIFLDATNLVLLELRDGLIRPPEASFRNPDEFPNRTTALAKLQGCEGLAIKGSETNRLLAASYREERFDSWLQRLTGGKASLEYGTGEWLAMMSGKELFNSIANEAFKVQNTNGTLLSGLKKNTAIARKLLALSLSDQPTDFQALVHLIKQRMT